MSTDQLLSKINHYGTVSITRAEVERIFPPPRRISFFEMQDTITLALHGLPVPKDHVDQADDLYSWCKKHGIKCEYLPEKNWYLLVRRNSQ